MRIVVLSGGESPEREVSLRSGKAVAKACQSAGFKVIEKDPSNGADILDGFDDPVVVFPILHGKGGEDGTIQRELENHQLPFLGTPSYASANCFDKWKTRQMLQAAGLPVASGQLVDERSYESCSLTKNPHVVKAVGGGSSIGTYIVRDPSRIDTGELSEVFTVSRYAVVEELIEGLEITVPILDASSLPIIEIIPPEGGEFDYQNKYNGATAEICPPERLTMAQQSQAKKLAENVHRVMGARHLSRIDIMLDRSGDMYVLEINTMPGMTDQSLYPKAARIAGIDYPDLMKRFVDLTKRDYGLQRL